MYGLLHRIEGPAIERINEMHTWYFRGEKLTEINYKQVMYYYHLYLNILEEIKFN